MSNQLGLIASLEDACNTGELITVIYHGGHFPGQKRRLFPLRVVGHLLYARPEIGMQLKTFMLDRLVVCDEDYPAEWVSEVLNKKSPGIKVDPEKYFGEWSYKIEKYHWPAFGVALREFIDKEQTKPIRDAAIANGMSKSEASKLSVKYLAHAVSTPPLLDFHDGDIFYSQHGYLPIQVVAKYKFIEVHRINIANPLPRQAFQLIDSELADWLRTGTEPCHSRITANLSYSDSFRFSIS